MQAEQMRKRSRIRVLAGRKQWTHDLNACALQMIHKVALLLVLQVEQATTHVALEVVQRQAALEIRLHLAPVG